MPFKTELTNLEFFRYICYENLELIRRCPLPEILPNLPNESVLIESRILPHLEFVIRNTILKLGAGWSHTVVCVPENFDYMLRLCNEIGSGIRVIKVDKKWTGVNSYNELMYDPEFWKALSGERVLFYHDDSIIFKDNIREFLAYDYIGAPWGGKPFGLEFGNGGLCLRNRRLALEILSDPPFVKQLINHLSDENAHFSGVKMDKPAEDLFFSLGFKLRSPHMPSAVVASYFSTEHIPNPDSFGGHQFWLFDPNWVDRMLKLLDGLKPTDPRKVF